MQLRPFLVLSLLGVLPLAAQVKVTQAKDRISVSIDGQPFTDFFIGPEANKPYLHPLRSASGKIVTRMYPMENAPGESHDHPHHRGLWFSHGDVNGLDFWGNEPSQDKGKAGRILLNKVVSVKSGKDQGSLEAIFRWVDPQGKTLLTEDRTMTFYSDPKLRQIDVDIRLDPKEKVTFGDTKEGTFAIRLATGLEEKHSGTMTDAEGRQKEKNVWGKRSPWVDYAGELNGEKLGIAIFDHPQNPRHPTYWHSRAYGLFAANIFGLHDFYNDKSKDGSMTIEPGQPLRFRYRVLIHPGDTQSAGIAAQYQRYSGEKESGAHTGQ
jgi:hypothetical protein